MPLYDQTITACPAPLPRRAFLRMLRLVRRLDRLSRSPAYLQAVLPLVPPTARHDPRHAAVMMGYDFHLDNSGRPWLIEVNTNAGGGLLAFLAHHSEAARSHQKLPDRLQRRFLDSFTEEMRRFTKGRTERPEHLAIIDERPSEQFLYGEMEAFAGLFREAWKSEVDILDPAQLQADQTGVYSKGQRIDIVYNRHCDFYLESPALAGIRTAWLAGSVCLTPNPFVYGLLADKRRMILWSDAESLGAMGVEEKGVGLLLATVPPTRLLADFDREKLWQQRGEWVFKPVDRFGSRGVFLGRKISRVRFEELVPAATLVQREIAPSETLCDGGAMKTDFRLYAYRDRILGVAARLYRGQVTNLRTPGGGFAPVRLIG